MILLDKLLPRLQSEGTNWKRKKQQIYVTLSNIDLFNEPSRFLDSRVLIFSQMTRMLDIFGGLLWLAWLQVLPLRRSNSTWRKTGAQIYIDIHSLWSCYVTIFHHMAHLKLAEVDLFSRSVSPSGATYLVTIVSVCMYVCLDVTFRTPPPPPQ